MKTNNHRVLLQIHHSSIQCQKLKLMIEHIFKVLNKININNNLYHFKLVSLNTVYLDKNKYHIKVQLRRKKYKI